MVDNMNGTASHGEGCACAGCASGHSVDDGHGHVSWLDYFGLKTNTVAFAPDFDEAQPSLGPVRGDLGIQPIYVTPVDGPTVMKAFDFGVTVIDQVGGTPANILEIFETITQIALNTWADFLGAANGASLEVQINVGGTTAVASAGPGTIILDSFDDVNGSGEFDFGDIGTLIAGSLFELQTGEDPNGAEADIVINVNENLITNGSFFFDPTLTQAVPPGQIDFYSVILHELGHGLGFFGFLEAGETDLPLLNFGNGLFVQAGTLYDQFIEYIDGIPHFTGANAVAAYGGAIPLESAAGPGSDISHFLGTSATNQNGINLQLALMNPFVIAGDRTSIGDLELAVMQDIGHTILKSTGFLINGIGDEMQAVIDGNNGGGGDPDEFIQGDGDPNDLMGGDGDDTLEGRNGNDTLDGAAGNDSIRGGNDDDILLGSVGDDTLIGERGDDALFGGDGDDTLFGSAGSDSLSGDGGNDTLQGGADEDTLNGGTGNDTVRGQAGDDVVSGGSGDDLVEGRAGDDVVDGGSGDDTVTGNAGSDTVSGGQGNDRLNGGNGDDLIVAGPGVDRLTGGSGSDMFDVMNAERAIIVDLNFGQNDTIIFADETITSEAELLAFIARDDVTATATGNNGNNLTIEYGIGQELVLQGEGDLLI